MINPKMRTIKSTSVVNTHSDLFEDPLINLPVLSTAELASSISLFFMCKYNRDTGFVRWSYQEFPASLVFSSFQAPVPP